MPAKILHSCRNGKGKDQISAHTDCSRVDGVALHPFHQCGSCLFGSGHTDWLVDHLKGLGVEDAEAIRTKGHPIVVWSIMVDPACPTVLVYGHYDVQPPDPLDLWTSPPFEPVIQEGVLYARGACDDKGQMFMHLKALECWMRTVGTPPVNLKFILEGEEEFCSASLPGFIGAHKEELSADVVVISDSSLFAPGIPLITYGLRGMTYVEITLKGPDRDLHSGTYGGAIHNPIHALATLIAGMHDGDHRITIDGFYDRVRPLSDDERRAMSALPFDSVVWAQEVGVHTSRTESGYSVLEASTSRPTLDCNGIWGGTSEMVPRQSFLQRPVQRFLCG